MATPTEMRAALATAPGSPLTIVNRPIPVPGAGEILVRVRASGTNPLDLKIRAGEAAHARQPLPSILGIDMAGSVAALGADVTGFAIGDAVFGMVGGVGGHQGTLADFIAVDADLLAKKPAALSFREAAVLPLTFITAWEGLVDRAHVAPGERVLVLGAAGGVGQMVLQLAKAKGADVFGLDRAAHGIDALVADATGGDGFDIVYDTAGGTTLDTAFRVVKPYTGRVVSALGWGSHALAPLSFRAASYAGVFTLLPLLTGKGRAHHGEILRAAAALADAGLLRPELDPSRCALDDADAAHAALRERRATGKVVIEMD